MKSFEITVESGREAEAFMSAIYRFAELRMNALDDAVVSIVSEPLGPVELKRVTLWSASAEKDFLTYWNSHPSRPAVRGRYSEPTD
jgi:hypothetical protein